MIGPVVDVHPALLGYVALFGGSALACFVGATRLDSVSDPDTRRGLVALLLTSGGWATAHVGFLVAPTPESQTAFYIVGLVIGLGAVGPWLYFCSAYSGRTFHRNETVRAVAAGAYLTVVLIKVTNPLHDLYFTSEFVTAPFPHLAVHHQPIHWLVMGGSYALATVGYFMLFERFQQVSFDTRPLLVLTGITGLPLILDIAGFASPLLIDITYEPVGVAAFAIGVTFVYATTFQAVQVTSDHEDPVIVLDDDDHIQEYNDAARDLFPRLDARDGVGKPLASLLPGVGQTLQSERTTVSLVRDGETRYYRLGANQFASGRSQLGRLILLDDVTESERYRRNLERQNERLEKFARVVSHDLRNPLEVAKAGVELEQAQRDSENVDQISNALDRMDALIDDVLTLARQGQPIDDLEPTSLGNAAGRSWDVVESGEATLEVDDDLTIVADPDRLQRLLENLFRNAIEHGGPDVTIRLGATEGRDGFYVEDDGPGIPPEKRSTVFDSGYSTGTDGTGFGLAIVQEIADAHEWEVSVTEGAGGGARFEVSGVRVHTEPDSDYGRDADPPTVD